MSTDNDHPPEEEDTRSRQRAGKYAPFEAPHVWPLTDVKDLKRLVRKYGADTVAKAALIVRPGRRGRPPEGVRPMLEAANLAEWIEEATEKHRVTRSKRPIRDAELELHSMLYPHLKDDADHIRTFLATLKKKRLRERRALEGLRAEADARERQKGRR